MLPVHTSFSENFLTTSRLDNFLSDSGGAGGATNASDSDSLVLRFSPPRVLGPNVRVIPIRKLEDLCHAADQ
jgi:hypothetical protein